MGVFVNYRSVLPIVVLVLLISGCAATAPTSGPTPTVTVTATPEATPPPEPTPRGADSPIEAIDAYVMCLPWATGYSAHPMEVEVAPFDDPRTVVTVRSDGNWFVYLHVINNREGYDGQEMATGCLLKGTMGDVEWAFTNTGAWQDPSTFEPDGYEEAFPGD
jgi:hypothetical protein